MLATESADSNRHQAAPNVSVPADVQGGDAVAVETPSVLNDALSVRSYPFFSCLLSDALSRPSLSPMQHAGPGLTPARRQSPRRSITRRHTAKWPRPPSWD